MAICAARAAAEMSLRSGFGTYAFVLLPDDDDDFVANARHRSATSAAGAGLDIAPRLHHIRTTNPLALISNCVAEISLLAPFLSLSTIDNDVVVSRAVATLATRLFLENADLTTCALGCLVGVVDASVEFACGRSLVGARGRRGATGQRWWW
jgi:hypothetical protein